MTKHNPSVLWHHLNLLNLRYHSGSLSNEMPIIQLSSLRQLDIFYPIRSKFHHLFSLSNLKPRWFIYHISFRDIGTKYNPSILCHHFNLSKFRYHSGSLSTKKPTIQLSSLRQLDIFNPIRAKIHHLFSFSKLEP